MKKLTVVLLISVCFAILCSCQQKKQEQQEQQESLDTANPYFTGKVIEIIDKGCLMEITNSGNGTFPIGEKMIVNTNIKGCPEYAVGDHLRISFDGKVALSYPGQVLNVFSVVKTNADGTP